MTRVLWEKELDDYYLGEPSTEQIEKIQNELNIVLPSSYVNLMKNRNGFYLTNKYFPTNEPNSWSEQSVYIDYLLGIGESPGILDTLYLRKEWGIRSQKLIIISAEPPMFLCLDYRNRKNPSVICIDVDENQEFKLAENFDELISGLVEYIEEEPSTYDKELTNEEVKHYYSEIDQVILKGTPKEVDRLFTKVLSTNNELIRYMVKKMKEHKKPKVQVYLLLFLMCCAEGENQGTIEDSDLLNILNDLSKSKNKEVKELTDYSLEKLQKRIS
ncbi:SMI1/KNR4 family protein [Alkalihalobacillus trypoxylicola]|uniref:Knr4/Smi1-like domain-containing protein n=1 Tax=Alkalihalobacillus trypoxylicola TaxID=519424 RepID=A0A161QAT6_9BACI|nr:SMI1/KNR4 family protein [Alkalihalobacillus trypoxylicola]KYG34957.1 hypothetical protein AZF04_01085 [Alkalihalobacillus trypoxylicola]